MEVKLLHNSPLLLSIIGARNCYNSFEKSDSINKNEFVEYGEKDLNLINNLIKNGHHSVLEHVYYTFKIDGISRALLQELVRHRIASYSVKSTRYTLTELKKDENIDVDKYCVTEYLPENIKSDLLNSLLIIKKLLNEGWANDKVKYLLPEAYKTNVIMSINARSLRNLFKLRTDKRALKEFQDLARNIFLILPHEHLILFHDVIIF